MVSYRNLRSGFLLLDAVDRPLSDQLVKMSAITGVRDGCAISLSRKARIQ